MKSTIEAWIQTYPFANRLSVLVENMLIRDIIALAVALSFSTLYLDTSMDTLVVFSLIGSSETRMFKLFTFA